MSERYLTVRKGSRLLRRQVEQEEGVRAAVVESHALAKHPRVARRAMSADGVHAWGQTDKHEPPLRVGGRLPPTPLARGCDDHVREANVLEIGTCLRRSRRYRTENGTEQS